MLLMIQVLPNLKPQLLPRNGKSFPPALPPSLSHTSLSLPLSLFPSKRKRVSADVGMAQPETCGSLRWRAYRSIQATHIRYDQVTCTRVYGIRTRVWIRIGRLASNDGFQSIVSVAPGSWVISLIASLLLVSCY